jgi:hypothetical protein
LLPGEQLLDSVAGMAWLPPRFVKKPGALMITDRRVLIYAAKVGGYETFDFSYSLLTSVEGVRALTWSYIQLTAAGSSAKFSGVGRENLNRLVGIMRDRIGVTTSNAARGTPPVEVAAEIRAVASLRDDGLITEEEFQAKKTQFLGL